MMMKQEMMMITIIQSNFRVKKLLRNKRKKKMKNKIKRKNKNKNLELQKNF